MDTDSESGKPKKRTRLNLSHMSLEEKIKRRKLKNREAAQLARDRKKAKMTDLEIATAHFAEERLKLAAENAAIRKQMMRLQAENQELRQRLSSHPVSGQSEDVDVKLASVTCPIGSAEPISVSQPQTQGQGAEGRSTDHSQAPASHWMMPFACLLAVMTNLTKSSPGCKSVLRDCCTSPFPGQQMPLEYQKQLLSMGIKSEDLLSLSRNWPTFGT